MNVTFLFCQQSRTKRYRALLFIGVVTILLNDVAHLVSVSFLCYFRASRSRSIRTIALLAFLYDAVNPKLCRALANIRLRLRPHTHPNTLRNILSTFGAVKRERIALLLFAPAFSFLRLLVKSLWA